MKDCSTEFLDSLYDAMDWGTTTEEEYEVMGKLLLAKDEKRGKGRLKRTIQDMRDRKELEEAPDEVELVLTGNVGGKKSPNHPEDVAYVKQALFEMDLITEN